MPKKTPLFTLVLICAVLTIPCLAFAQTTPPQLSVTTNKNVYLPGDTIIITGSTYPVSSTPLSIQILGPDSNPVQLSQVSMTQNGLYSTIFVAGGGPLWQKYGLYTVIVERGSPNLQAQTTFYFESTNTTSQPTQKVIVSTDKQSYSDGDSMVISGNVAPFDPYKILTLQILDPIGHLVQVEEPNVSQDGMYSVNLTTGTSMWSSTGTYAVKVQYGSSNDTAQTTFSYNAASTTSENQPQSSATPSKIPAWVRNDFIWYGQGTISEDDLLGAIKFLVDNGIIQLRSN